MSLEPPLMRELVVDTDGEPPQQSVRSMVFRLQSLGYIEATTIEELAPNERLTPNPRGSAA